MNEGGSSELGGPCLCSFSLAPRALVGDGEERAERLSHLLAIIVHPENKTLVTHLKAWKQSSSAESLHVFCHL